MRVLRTMTMGVTGDGDDCYDGCYDEDGSDDDENNSDEGGYGDGYYDSDNNGENEDGRWNDCPGRSAPEVLKDIVTWYQRLLKLPGGRHTHHMWDPEGTTLKPFYEKHGWPSDAFDGDAFLVELIRVYARSEDPSGDPEEEHLARLSDSISRVSESALQRMADAIDQADNIEDEWMARLAQSSKISYEESLAFELARANPNKPKPALSVQDSLPFWEMESIRTVLSGAQDHLSHLEQEEKHAGSSKESKQRRIALKQARLNVYLYQRAFDECKADCAAQHPGMTFTEATARKHLTLHIPPTKEQLILDQQQQMREQAALKDWLDTVPKEATRALMEATGRLENYDLRLTGVRGQLSRV